MKKIFAVIRRHGTPWQSARCLEDQPDWQGHAEFMDALFAEGFVLLAGPLGDSDAMLIVRAESAEEVNRRLEPDPWTQLGLLVTTRVEPWTLRIGSLPAGR